MVSTALRSFSVLLFLSIPAFGQGSNGVFSTIPDLKVGEAALQEIKTPIALTVVNAAETDALRQKEILRIPVICRYMTNAADLTENALRSSFLTARSNFLDVVENAFNRRSLGTQQIAGPKFQRITATFRRQNRSFPLSDNLAEMWATGESDRVFLNSLATRLREAMKRPIRAGIVPPEMKLTFTVRLAYVTNWEDKPTLADVQKWGTSCRNTNITTMLRTREELSQTFNEEDRPLARYLTSFVTSNCAPALDLTREVRERRTENLWASDRYEAGDVLLKQGELVTAKSKAALDQLREKIVSLTPPVVVAKAVAPQNQSWADRGGIFWLGAAFVVGIAVSWRVARRRPAQSLLPAVVGQRGMISKATIPCPSCSEPVNVPVLVRASDASDRTWLRARLAHFLENTFVRKLLAQRSELVDTQQQAAFEMAEMDARLEKLHAPLQARLQAYEQRIRELEKELADRGHENRELIKAKIQLMRRQLQQSGKKVELN